MGVWLGRDPAANEREMELGLAAAKRDAGTLRGIVVGNEVLLRRELTEKALAGYIERMNAATDVPVTYADVWEFWQAHPELAKVTDYVTIHILPYWEDEPVAPEKAIRHVADVYQRMDQGDRTGSVAAIHINNRTEGIDGITVGSGTDLGGRAITIQVVGANPLKMS